MAKNQNAFMKKQRAELKRRKKKEKFEEKLQRKSQPKDGSLENMTVYVDEFGNLSETPPEPPTPKKQLNQTNSRSNSAAQNK